MIQITEYNNTSEAGVIELILDIQTREFGVAITLEDQPDLLRITKFYQHGCGNFWTALKDNRVIGTISLLDISNHQVALRKMFVHRDYRGKEFNVAANLLHKALDWSREMQVREIFLGTTAKYHAAHRFYEKHQFMEIKQSELPPRFPVMEVDTKFYKYAL
ncbi:MAG: GNAT family N-acetyltransferase [Desulfobulbaceae bacterium]|nr:MAG: GNAT family N-acetyltransferase [Desulfobulbaceae bacterium]